ncbi:hypothetical protein ACFQ4W_07420, partial [Scopulibacillus daqui]|uniref:hypothetical protein n=1 Tax=Scopulibacillus daqui TaxID=1469162 RepID=UPI00363BCE3F
NTVVKLFSADGNWGLPPVRVGRRQASAKKGQVYDTCPFLIFFRLISKIKINSFMNNNMDFKFNFY